MIYHRVILSAVSPQKGKTNRKDETMKTKENRHGKHDPDKVQFGGMVSPEFKAIAQLTASKTKCTLMDLMQRGVYNIAMGAGIMRGDNVAPEYQEAVDALADIIRTQLAKRRGK